MKKAGRIIAVAAAVGLVIGGYYYFSVVRNPAAETGEELTEVQRVITKDMEENYPATPREVVKDYNRILNCLYNEEYTEKELYALGDQARLLFDEELLDNNPRDAYFDALTAELESYKEASKKIMSIDVCDSNDVDYQTVRGDECAYVRASYFMDENKSYSRANQMYVLRKDDDGKWKILGFYELEGDASNGQ